MNDFRPKDVFILILLIVIAIAFMESISWRDFLLKVIGYGIIAELVAILWSNFRGEKVEGENSYIREANLKVNLGKDIDNQDCFIDFKERNINLTLLVGVSGAGKSVLHNHIYQQLVKQNSPEQISFILIDNTHVDFTIWNQESPYLYTPTITDQNLALDVLDTLASRIEEINTGSKHYFIHIEECNQFVNEPERIRRILNILFDSHKDNKVHLIFSTSRPAPQIIPNWLLELTDLRIIFKLASPEDYITVADEDFSNVSLDEKGDKLIYLFDQITQVYPLNIEEVISAEKFKLK
jgi:hypothetical protein